MGSHYIGEEKSCLGNAATVTPRSCEHRLSGRLAGSRPAAQPTAREPQQSRGQRHPRLIRQSQGPRGSGNNWRISSPFPVFNTRLSSVWFEDAEVSRSWVSELRGKEARRVIINRRASEFRNPAIAWLVSAGGAGAVGKNAQQKKKVPQRCFRYGPGAGFPSQHAMPAGVRLMSPQNPAPQKCHIPLLLPSTQPANCCRSRPLLPKIIGARGRSSTSPITTPR